MSVGGELNNGTVSVSVADRTIRIRARPSGERNYRGRPKAIRRDETAENRILKLSLPRLRDLGAAFSVDRHAWSADRCQGFFGVDRVSLAKKRVGRRHVADRYELFEANLLIISRLADLAARQCKNARIGRSKTEFLRACGLDDSPDVKTFAKLRTELGVTSRDVDFAILFAERDCPCGEPDFRFLCIDLSRPVIISQRPGAPEMGLLIAMTAEEAAALPVSD